MAAPTALTGDPSSMLGPTYNYAEELLPPSAIGVAVGDSFSQVYNNIKGVNYYVDAIGFGQGTFLNDKPMKPLGLRYFLDTGFVCSNGAKQYQYIDTTPQGDSMGELVKTELSKQGLPAMRGLAPGMLEDAQIALNPVPLFRAAMGDTGYSECERVEKPVGDLSGKTVSRGGTVWLTPDVVRSGVPYQTRWVSARPISASVYAATPKIYNADGTLRPAGDLRVLQVRGEAFTNPHAATTAAAVRDINLGRSTAGAVVLAAAALAMLFI
jgi:hypothetical protein